MSYDKELTARLLGEVGPLRFNPWVIKRCAGCGKAEKRRYRGGKRQGEDYRCRRCTNSAPEVRAKSSESLKRAWQDQEYRDKITANSIKCSGTPEARERSRQAALKRWESDEFRQLVCANSRAIWLDPELRRRMSAFRDSPEFRNKMAEVNRARRHDVAKMAARMRDRWADSQYRERMVSIMSQLSLEKWADKDYRDKIVEATRRSWTRPEYREAITGHLQRLRLQMPRVSSLQTVLYSLLDDLGVSYYGEHEDRPPDPQCCIGPYLFDCVIPRPGRPTLLVECQGEYWHSLERVVRRDVAKSSYISNNFRERYELKYLWEHEFLCPDKIRDTIRYWLRSTDPNAVRYELGELDVRPAPPDDYKLLLSKYHYLPNAGRGGLAYGAYLGDTIVAVCVFSPLPRQNMEMALGVSAATARELSRLCVHPGYRQDNLLSWFVARALRLLPAQYTTVVSYCDTTFNHNGAVYRACNFTQDGVVPPDYWYASDGGWAVHKRTLYGQAVRMGMTESQYAATVGYRKVFGSEKLRFVYRRS